MLWRPSLLFCKILRTCSNKRLAKKSDYNDKTVQNCTKLYKTVQNCTKLYKTLQNCTKLYKTVQNWEYTWHNLTPWFASCPLYTVHWLSKIITLVMSLGKYLHKSSLFISIFRNRFILLWFVVVMWLQFSLFTQCCGSRSNFFRIRIRILLRYVFWCLAKKNFSVWHFYTKCKHLLTLKIKDKGSGSRWPKTLQHWFFIFRVIM